MSRMFGRIAVVVLLIALMLVVPANAARALSAGAVMTVSRTTQDSVIDEGDNFTIDVQTDGVEPARYIWYFNGELIEGAESSVYGITAATREDAGVYRVEAYSEEGKMLVIMEFDLRVIDKALPKSGDDTLGIVPVISVMTLSAAALAAVIRRRLCA